MKCFSSYTCSDTSYPPVLVTISNTHSNERSAIHSADETHTQTNLQTILHKQQLHEQNLPV